MIYRSGNRWGRRHVDQCHVDQCHADQCHADQCHVMSTGCRG